jgi:hypothetical protein
VQKLVDGGLAVVDGGAFVVAAPEATASRSRRTSMVRTLREK